jgi:hypothetical protein
MDWTPAELQLIIGSIDFPPGTNYNIKELIVALGDVIDIDGITESMVSSTVAGVATPEALAAATALATRQARKIAADLTKAELAKIAQKVRDNIEAGNAFDNLHGLLSEITGLDKNRAATLAKYKASLQQGGVSGKELVDKVEAMREKLLRDRRKVIAQTEQRMATENGKMEVAQTQGHKYKRWITAQDDLVSDPCESNQAQGWIGINDSFSSGHGQPPEHPRCRCTFVSRTAKPGKPEQRRVDAAADRTAEAKAD